MKRFARLIGRLPFCGKLTIRPLFFGLYRGMTRAERRDSYLALMLTLAVFIPVHAFQALMGVAVLCRHPPVWAAAIGGLYALANACVTLTQFQLACWTTWFYCRAPLPSMRTGYTDYTSSQAVYMLAVTLGGQFLFLAVYAVYV